MAIAVRRASVAYVATNAGCGWAPASAGARSSVRGKGAGVPSRNSAQAKALRRAEKKKKQEEEKKEKDEQSKEAARSHTIHELHLVALSIHTVVKPGH